MRASRDAPREAGVDHIASNDYAATLVDLKRRIRAAQQRALRSVNAELVQLYWQIGELIHQRQAAAGWGRSVVQRLAADLQKEFPGRSGFSGTNLWLMKRLYEAYYRAPKLQMLSEVLGWSQNVAILTRCQDDLEREFYLRATARFGWSHAVLRHQLDTHAYHRFLNNQTNFDRTLPEPARGQARLAVKDHYTFDFLDLGEQHDERQLELALLANLRALLLEMGSLFTFVGSQHRLEVGGQAYFIDLLLYHRGLRALVAIELKARDFQPEHKGKMEFYLEALDAQQLGSFLLRRAAAVIDGRGQGELPPRAG
jgi:predicted nuclease of restriction endonuclease-like (RecB) superfamily